MLQVIESRSRVNSFMGGAARARARVSPAVATAVSAAPALIPLSSLGCALVPSGAAVADAHATAFTLHRVGGFPVRPKICSCLRGGGRGKFSAGCPVEQVVVQSPERRPGAGTRRSGGGAVTPLSTWRFLTPFLCHLDAGKGIRQGIGWKRVRGTAVSGIWVLKGDARARMLPANLEHLRVEWRKRGSYETAWVTPGHDCLCPYKYGHGAAVRTQTKDSIWDEVISFWGRVAPLLSPWCARGKLPTGVNLNRYSGPGSCIRWHSDNEPLFGPPNQPELVVSVSLGH